MSYGLELSIFTGAVVVAFSPTASSIVPSTVSSPFGKPATDTTAGSPPHAFSSHSCICIAPSFGDSTLSPPHPGACGDRYLKRKIPTPGSCPSIPPTSGPLSETHPADANRLGTSSPPWGGSLSARRGVVVFQATTGGASCTIPTLALVR